MNKFESSKVFLLILSLFASIFTLIYLVCTGNNYSLINEAMMEMTYSTSLNKSCGINLLYILSFSGVVAYTIFYYFAKYKKNNSQSEVSKTLLPKITVVILGIVTIITYFIWQYEDYIFTYLFLFSLCIYFVNKENILNGIILFIMNIYSLFALYRILTLLGFSVELYDTLLFCVISFILSYFLLKIKISKVILIEQFILPFLLLIYTVDSYGFLSIRKTISIPVLWQVKVLIFGLIFAFLTEAIFLIKKYWGQETSLNKIMSYGACVSIMGYNLCQFVGNIVPDDAHHYSENIIGFHQIFQMGQVPFREFMPVSGFYSVVHGALLQLFGNGLISQYISVDNIFCLLLSLLIVFLLTFHTDKIIRFLISVSFLFPILFPSYSHYDRVLFILPIMLILSLPKLIENKNLWLCAWILTSLFHGLYYPVFGVAVCIGFLPLAVYQFITLVFSKEIINQVKTLKFWFCWVVTLSTVALSYPLLAGMYKLIKLMGNHSAFLGISRFGQHFNSTFMPMTPIIIKQITLYILTFVVPALLVWVTYAFTLKILNLKFNKKLSNEDIKNSCLVFSLVLIPLFSFSYTMLRLEADKIFVRAEAVIIAVLIMLILFAQKYLNTDKNKYYIVGFALCLISISSSWGFTNNGGKLLPRYRIPSSCDFIENDTLYKIGSGFIDSDYYNAIQKMCLNFDKQNNYFGIGPYATYYICDVKGVSFLESLTIRYRAITENAIKSLLENNAIIDIDLDCINNYYYYNWLITSGDYVWNEKLKLFLPNNGKYSTEQVKKINSNAKLNLITVDAGYVPASLAPSLKGLSDDFIDPKLKFTIKNYKNYQRINFEKFIDGNDADFVYIKFEGPLDNYECALHEMTSMYDLKKKCDFIKPFVIHDYNSDKMVQIDYSDNYGVKHSILSHLQRGELLIPLGSAPRWLLHTHSYIDVKILRVNKNKRTINTINQNKIKIKDARFLKLKGVNVDD